ncbi:thiol:disulfide interchange protein DsbA/DsbL [Thalassotalea crassostreae]|uniref:thiol:disulfide interchange protein DsbA/DsbL n=1 Tax=Thalassotalea crassostreae TaxID=1763536 RepID=UPI00083836C5|nr:thiol:disulfide interchange protein DsbA/DsbL [Thalassotalea crassostreae]
MKKFVGIIFAALLMPFSALAADYEAGKHYTVINETITAKPEVREYFSFYCPACLAYEPVMHKIEASLPNGTPFVKNHVDFMRAASPEVQFGLTKTIVAAEEFPQKDLIIAAIFNAIQKERKPLATLPELVELVAKTGADAAKFEKLMNSFGVNSKAKQMKKSQDLMTKKRVLTGVPTIIVNGKYRVNAKELSRADIVNDYVNIVNYLLTLK